MNADFMVLLSCVRGSPLQVIKRFRWSRDSVYIRPLLLTLVNMKSATLIIFVVLVAAVSCYPDKTDIKKLKEEANRKKACMHDCAKVAFEPVCAGKQGDKPKSFGSECVLNNYNCENKDSLAKISKGECPGSDGIRLS